MRNRVRCCLTASSEAAPELGRRSVRDALGSASTSYLPARRSAPTTTKIPTRNGSSSSQVIEPCDTRTARSSSNRGTSSSSPQAPLEHTR